MKMNCLELLKTKKEMDKKDKRGQKNGPSVVSGRAGTKWLMFWQLVSVYGKCG